jgi:hypothetical protein
LQAALLRLLAVEVRTIQQSPKPRSNDMQVKHTLQHGHCTTATKENHRLTMITTPQL